MKKFLKKTILFTLCVGIVSTMLCVVIDPFNVFHPLNARNTGADPNLRYIKVKYLLENPEKYDAFIFGSCRASTIYAERMEGIDRQYRFYNMTIQGGATWEDLENLRVLLQNGITVKKIYVGLDDVELQIPGAGDISYAHASYELSQKHPLKFWPQYVDPTAIGGSLPYLINQIRKVPDKRDTRRIYTNGNYWSWEGERSFDGSGLSCEPAENAHIDEALDTICEIISLCEANNVEYVFFAMPLYRSWFASIQKPRGEFFTRLAEITPFYNFCGINNISTDDKYWFSEGHFCTEVGNLMVDAMCNGKCPEDLYAQGFGWYVTEDNVDELLALPEMSGAAVDK